MEDALTPFRKVLILTESLLIIACTCVFTYSGIEHLANPGAFAVALGKYNLVGSTFGAVVLLILPATQVITAVLLLSNDTRFAGFVLATAQFASFAFAQWSVLLRGLTIDCGCFGALSTTVSPISASLVSFLFLASASHLFISRRRSLGREN